MTKARYCRFNDCVLLLSFLLIVSEAFAISVDRIVIVPQEPDVYVRNVKAVLNTETGQTLVVWETHPCRDEDHAIWGQLLQQDGKPVGARFQIIRSSLNPFGTSLTYDPDANQFVLVFAKAKLTEFQEIYAIRLKPTGRPKGKPVLVSHPHSPGFEIFNNRPVVFYDSENKANIILWHRYVEGPADPSDSKGVYGAILNANLTVRKKPVLVQTLETGPGSTFGPFITDVAIHTPTGKLLLGQDIDTPVTFQSKCFVSQIDRTLKTPATLLILDDGLHDLFCTVEFMQLPNGQMRSVFAREDGIKKRKINSGGAPTGAISKFFAEPARNVALELLGLSYASSNVSKEFAVLGFVRSEIETAQFWFQRANAKGKAIGPAVEIESGVDCVHGGTISALPFIPKGGHLYAVLYIEGERDAPPLVNQGSGLVLLRVNTAE